MKLIESWQAEIKLNKLKKCLTIKTPLHEIDEKIEKYQEKIDQIQTEIDSLEWEIDGIKDEIRILDKRRDFLIDNKIENLDDSRKEQIQKEIQELEGYLKVINHPNQKRLEEFTGT